MTIFSQINIKESKNNIPVISPLNQQIIGYAKNISNADIIKIIDKAIDAQKIWKKTHASERSKLLIRWNQLILEHTDELANIINLENGKILSDAKSEIAYGASFVEWFASEATKIQGSYSEGSKTGQKIITKYEPVGPVAAITPWNFPNAMITRKIAPALAAGCVIILKPSELTPFSALALEYLAKKAGFPDGVINIVTGDSKMIGETLCNDFRIRKISFTGSTSVGKLLYKQSADSLKRISLELGGNAPFIICDDVNIENTIKCLIPGKIRSSSQACTSPNRIFIHNSIYEKTTKMLASNFEQIKIGQDIGPLIDQEAVDKVINLISDAKSKGATILCGGTLQKETFFEPTVIVNCTDDMNLFKEEIFAPVLACYRFDTIDEVIERANNTEYGLASYVFSNNSKTIQDLSDKLDFGIVGINTAIISNYKGAFGGRKASGFGVEGSHLGIYEYLNTKYICEE